MGHAGVLVLSEFAGAAQSLGAGAILVNPWNITDMAAAIEDALTMSDQASTCKVSVFCWGCGFASMFNKSRPQHAWHERVSASKVAPMAS